MSNRLTTLEEVRLKWPKANYAPRVDCKFCGGTGERTNRPGACCICIFVAHEACDEVASGLAKTAKRIREEMKLGEPPSPQGT